MNKIKIISILLLVSITVSIIITCDIVKGDSLVDSETIKNWANSYISEYMKIIEDHFGHEYGYYFDFFGKHFFKIKSVISTLNGVAISMISTNDTSKMGFEYVITDKKIASRSSSRTRCGARNDQIGDFLHISQ